MRAIKLTALTLAAALALGAACRDASREQSAAGNGNAPAPPPAASPGPAEPASSPSATEVAPSPSPAAGPVQQAGATGVGVQASQPPGPQAAAPRQPEAKGWRVFSVSGEWTVDGAEGTLSRGAWLRPGAVVRLRPAPGQRIYLTLVDGSHTARKECDPPDVCAGGWRVPGVSAEESTVSHVVNVAVDLLSRRPHIYINPISRDGGLREAVLLLEKGGADLGPAVGRLTPGRHVLLLEPLGGDGGAAPVRLDFTWEFRQKRPLRASGLRPGLYQLKLDAPDDGQRAADAWVLVETPARHRQTAARFGEAVEVRRAWGETVDGDAARGFLRAYLEHLSRRRERR